MVEDLKVSKAHRRPGRTRFAKEMPDGPAGGSRANGIHDPPTDDDPSIRQEFLVAAYRSTYANNTHAKVKFEFSDLDTLWFQTSWSVLTAD